LVPGITNVTDRARYYSFHPWLLRAFDSRYEPHTLSEFQRVLRRAECLFALIAIRHARVANDDAQHGEGMVGRQALLRIPEDAKAIRLEDYAGLDAPHRYFLNKLGGFGQYYFGPLRDLRIVDRIAKSDVPGYDRQRGEALANAFASGVPERPFFQVLEARTFAWNDLDSLKAFCPCRLSRNPAEQFLLTDLFFGRTELFRTEGADRRRATLALLLELASHGQRLDGRSFEDVFRAATYTGALPDGTTWTVAQPLQHALRGWATYQRNELLSLALQGLFAAVLRAVERDSRARLEDSAAAGEVAIRLVKSLRPELIKPLATYLDQVRTDLPPLSAWKDPEHELQLGWRVDGAKLKEVDLEALATNSVRILASLLARGVDDYPYADVEIDSSYFGPQDIHLLSLRQAFRNQWAGLTVADWIRWLAVEWGISRHLRVALRKLRGERRDTFRIRPLDGHLQVVEAPEPTYTVPRVGRSLQILQDLDLLEFGEETLVPTAAGRRELAVACGA
jgi:hypothetical protein